MPLLIATRNPHKLQELRELLRVADGQLLSADQLPALPDVEEDGATFVANALKKARTLCAASGLWTLADDSGLEVEALQGAPGVRSARFAGVQGDDAANNPKLLEALAHQPCRTAQFRCVLALVAPDGREWTVEGTCRGRILEAPRGRHGFGYDPLFLPDGATRSFAELTEQEKNRVSHRGHAIAAARREWPAWFAEAGVPLAADRSQIT